MQMQLHTILGRAHPHAALVPARNPAQLFVAYASGSVFVYEIHLEQWGERPVGTLHHPTSVTALLHMEENAVVSACTDRRIRIWCARGGAPRTWAACICRDAQGLTFLFGTESSALLVRALRRDMGTLVCLATLQGHQSAVTCLTRNDDGEALGSSAPRSPA